MDYRMRLINGLIFTALVAILLAPVSVLAKSSSAAAAKGTSQRYIVILDDPPLATYDGSGLSTPEKNNDTTRLLATSNRYTGASKLDVKSQRSRQYLQFLDDRFKHFRGEALLRLGRQLNTVHRYRNALNGFSTDLTASEARNMRDMPGVKAVMEDEIQHLETDSGPAWIGADKIYAGSVGFPASGGEGVVVGVIDSGVNWDHPSFSDPGAPGFNHVNPYGSQLGLCSNAEVLCNDKLVGVYEFVVDNPNTATVEESNNGKDNAGHGSHVASTAAGNPINLTLNGIPTIINGVAANANIVSYRVCYIGNPADGDDDGCQNSAILGAIDQAITDGVDVINYSIGGGAFSPWSAGSTPIAFLNARAAGIFVATSGGNEGPNAGSIGSPANAPWIMAVGSASHDRVLGNLAENLSGGDTTPPDDLVGASFTAGVGIRQIVHAKDFGNALCGTGPTESGPECSDNTGASSPFAANTFSGEIVVCDRGVYGRVEKGKNVLLAGAGGYILANTDAQGEAIVPDDHCLPATHIGDSDGDMLRTWLDSGVGHQGSISAFSILHIASAGDEISSFSSRGPNLPPVIDVMKPDVIAPGSEILAANDIDQNFAFLSGTSMASPHVTGGAALLKSVHPGWSPTMLASALAMTATPERAHDFDGSEANVHKVGAGRPRLDQAVNAGLYLNETQNGFLAANPSNGGSPKDLNLPGLVDTACHNSCSFQRRVTDLVGGASWTSSVSGLVPGVSVSVSPDNFSLIDGAQQLLTINVDLTQSEIIGTWIYGEVRLSSVGLPDSVFPLAIFADGGSLPNEWLINTDDISGWQEFALDGLAAQPDATFASAGLVVPTETVENLPEDPTNDSPYDNSAGLMTTWHTVPADALWLHTETLASTSDDLDLFVGLDSNGDGIAQESEQLCSSTSPTEIELCDLFTPVAGDYWVIVQNWARGNILDEATLVSAVVGKNTTTRLDAFGNGIVASDASQNVRVSWDNVNVTPGTELLGAVGIGTRRETPNDIGIVPVKFTKTAVASPETLVLMNGISRGLTLDANGMHDRAYVDVPPGAASLSITASGADSEQNNNLVIELYRMGFDDAFTNPPFATAPDMSGDPLAMASGESGSGPVVTVNGASLVPGRWFAVIKNNSATPSSATVQADISFAGNPIAFRGGLWQPSSRPNIRQGYDFNSAGGNRALLWYTFDEDGSPAWYLAASAEQAGNVWVAELRRFTNDGALQQSAPVGHVSVTTLAEEDEIFSFVLFGKQGSDRAFPTSAPVCPVKNNVKLSYTGIWSKPVIGLGGASVLVNAVSQGYIHYIYDDLGKPVWLIGADATDNLPDTPEMSLLQWNGYCAVCSEIVPSNETVGVFTRDFVDEANMSWNLNYVLNPPLSGSVDRTDITEKLTNLLSCQ